MVLQFTPHNCLKSEGTLQSFMVKLASERGMFCPCFVAVNSFFPFSFLFFFHSKDDPSIITLFFLLSALLDGFRVLTDCIVTFACAKTRTDSHGASLFDPVNIKALRCTKTLAHRVGATVMVPRFDGKAPHAEYRDLFRGFDVVNRDFFVAVMTECIASP